jgi:hypothetical protein
MVEARKELPHNLMRLASTETSEPGRIAALRRAGHGATPMTPRELIAFSSYLCDSVSSAPIL